MTFYTGRLKSSQKLYLAIVSTFRYKLWILIFTQHRCVPRKTKFFPRGELQNRRETKHYLNERDFFDSNKSSPMKIGSVFPFNERNFFVILTKVKISVQYFRRYRLVDRKKLIKFSPVHVC